MGKVNLRNSKLSVVKYLRDSDYGREMELNVQNILCVLKEIKQDRGDFGTIVIDEPYILSWEEVKELGIRYLPTHEMKIQISKTHKTLFINIRNYSTVLHELVSGTDNYLISFECPEYEKKAMQIIDTL